MKKSKNQTQKVNRFEVNPATGLNYSQIEERISQNLTNDTHQVRSNSIGKILFKNIFTFFNMICLAVAIALWGVGAYSDTIFMLIVIANTLISIIQEIKAKNTIDKLTLTNSNFTKVLREGEAQEIYKKEVVLDDILCLSSGMQIASDSIVVEGEIEVNESLLTGESLAVKKHVGDNLLAGSFVSSGTCKAKVDKVGSANYIEKLSSKAKKYSNPKSELLISLNVIIRLIGIIIIPIGVLMFFNNYSAYNKDIFSTVTKTAGSIVGMIPAGMFLLTSVALAVSVVRLSKKRTLVQELYCIEMLARVNVLCLDKTGTLTDGSMKVREMVSLTDKFDEKTINKIMASIVGAFHEANHTAIALKSFFGKGVYTSEKSLPFSSERKFMGCSFKKLGTFKVGAYEYVMQANKKIAEKAEEYAQQGLRVLLLVESDKSFSKENCTPLAFVLLEDNIRKDAPQTIQWFKENGVEVKVISGDNPLTVSEVARRVGIDNYDNYISLQGMSKQDVAEIADKYTIFGRVSPEQKAILVKSMKNKGKTVAMTGDGVNDILALKEADCSVAIAAGSDAARSVSHMVLLDSNFSSMPSVVKEGRRVVNNIQKSSSLFLMKTIFTVVVSIIVLIMGRSYPFSPAQFMTLEYFVIGLPSFFLALQPNHNIIKGKFISNLLRNALPAGITLVLSTMAMYVYQYHTGISNEITCTMASIALTCTGLIILFNLCKPFNPLKAILVA
ncbi:MAG: HAD-IC family P-type ATPase, partial [Clostridia bacterium]|nr:HAD-IC family P-type ATPase [Clostridia bacterium]